MSTDNRLSPEENNWIQSNLEVLAHKHPSLLVNQLAKYAMAMQQSNQPPITVSKDQIREVFTKHGFTVKEGLTDLKPYVYDAAYALLQLRPDMAMVEQLYNHARQVAANAYPVMDAHSGPTRLGDFHFHCRKMEDTWLTLKGKQERIVPPAQDPNYQYPQRILDEANSKATPEEALAVLQRWLATQQ